MSHIKQDEQDIERLLNAAGRREAPPDDMRARVYAKTLQAWQELPEQPRQSEPARAGRPTRYLALAASTLVAVALGIVMFGERDVAGVGAARVAYVKGSFLVGEGVAGMVGAELGYPAKVRTNSDSMVTLRAVNGALVTLDQNTHLSLTGADELRLQRGRIYVDASGPRSALSVVTKHTKIVDVGTQFEVEVSPGGDELLIAMREGRVDVHSANHEFSAVAEAGTGEVIYMSGDVVTEKEIVTTTDARWDWRRAGRQAYALAGSTVHDYLVWMARDSGHELNFNSNAVEQMSKIGFLQGRGSLRSSDDTDIEDALAATRFRIARPREGQWVVHFRS